MKSIITIIIYMTLILSACAKNDIEILQETSIEAQKIVVESTPSPTIKPIPTIKPTPEGPYAYIDYFATQKILDDAVINVGNTDRIIAAMQKAQRGEDIKIGVIGGSITWGASADIDKTYAKNLLKWWKKKFPNIKVKLVNAGKSGTGSIIGAHRVKQDLLDKDIDFMIVEFAVNDTEDKIVSEAYENLLRQVLLDKNNPGLMLLMMCSDGGYSSEEDKIDTGLHYNLPIISYKSSVYAAVQRGELVWDEIADDFIHPDNIGHLLISEMIIYQLENLYVQIDKDVDINMELPEPKTQAFYTNASLLTNNTLNVAEIGGFEKDDNASWVLPKGFKAIESNNDMVFKVKAKSIILVFNQSINNKCANVKVTVDGKDYGIITSKSPFEWEAITCVEILREDSLQEHKIKLTMLDELPDGCIEQEFRLLAVLISE